LKGRTDLITFALNDYRKITESLRMYEREVEQAMRDSGQLISRASIDNYRYGNLFAITYDLAYSLPKPCLRSA
jgi:hypothetical protein